jgi:hypothetical protein
VYVNENGEFNMEGEAVISGNGTGYAGGGVYMIGGEFNMQDKAVIRSNSAVGRTIDNASGGGVAVRDGVFNMTGDAEISGNIVTGDFPGGGVYVCPIYGSSTPTFTMTSGKLLNNTAPAYTTDDDSGNFYNYNGTAQWPALTTAYVGTETNQVSSTPDDSAVDMLFDAAPHTSLNIWAVAP